MYCRSCGANVREDSDICLNCGIRPLKGASYCQSCGTTTQMEQELCVKCGMRLKRMTESVADNADFSNLPAYYEEEFRRIRISSEGYKGKWNWAAFLFGPIWALTKGVWLPPLIVLLLCWTYIVPLVYWFIFGARGNYMYYCVHVRNKQLPL